MFMKAVKWIVGILIVVVVIGVGIYFLASSAGSVLGPQKMTGNEPIPPNAQIYDSNGNPVDPGSANTSGATRQTLPDGRVMVTK